MQKLIYSSILLLVFCVTKINSFANTEIDSLRNELKHAKTAEEKCDIYLEMGDYFEFLIHDSALYYYEKCRHLAKDDDDLELYLSRVLGNIGVQYHYAGNLNKASEYYIEALGIRSRVNDTLGKATIYNNLGVINRSRGQYEEAIENYEKSLLLYIAIEKDAGIARAYNNIAIVNSDRGIYDVAIEYFFKALEVNSKAGHMRGVSMAYNNIGNTYHTQGNYDAALTHYNEALEIAYQENDKRLLSSVYNNIGNIFIDEKDYENALTYHNRSLEIKEEISDRMGMSSSYINIGNIHRSLGEYELASENYHQALEIDIELGDKRGQAIVYNNIANLYMIMIDSVPGINVAENANMALYYGKESFSLAKEIGALPVKNNTSEILKNAYKSLGNYKEALEFAEIYISTNKTMFDEEKTKALTEMQTKYETEKKQQEIEKQNLVIEKQEIDNRRQRNQRNFFVAGSFMLTLLVVFVFRGYIQKKRSNELITEKNALLIEANEEIHAQKDEIEAQHDMVIRQKEQIEIQKIKIEDSIRYARRIQAAVMPKEEKANNLLGEHFILFKPKDVVSGDFYWATEINDLTIITVADCTGHGVPGAFMSMLGVSFLNEIVRKKEVNNPAMVLNQLRNNVVEALGQTIKGESQNDGMDMSLLVLDKENNKCLWAGARLPLWIIRHNKKEVTEEAEETDIIEEIKPDKMTIAIGHKMHEFNYHEIAVEKGDRLYMFSDGIVDQFGGPDGKKFMTRQLKAIVKKTSSFEMDEQKKRIEAALNNWLHAPDGTEYPQIDDMTMIGILI